MRLLSLNDWYLGDLSCLVLLVALTAFALDFTAVFGFLSAISFMRASPYHAASPPYPLSADGY